MSSKALLVGTSFSAVPLFNVLKQRDLTLSVCGNLSSDPCHRYVEHSYAINYAIKEDLYELVRREAFDFIVPSCNDYSYMSCAWVAEQLDYPGFDTYETTRLLHHKDLFRKFTQAHGFPVPYSVQLEKGGLADLSPLKMPALVKPVDSFSGRGITKVMQSSELNMAVDHAFQSSNAETIVIEEFVDGSLHSHSCYIADGEIIFEIMADEFCSVYPYQVDCSNIPSRLSAGLQARVSECMKALISKLALNDGLLHTQLIVKDDQFWIIECMRRAPGDLYGTMVQLATEVDYWKLYVQPFIKEKLVPPSQPRSFHNIARHTLSVEKGRYFQCYSSNIQAQQLISVPLKDSGHYLDAAPYDKAGIIFAEFETTDELFERSPHLAEHFNIR